jgi:Trk-type K+ transport system membrane component
MVLIITGGLGWRVTSDLATQALRRGRSRRRLSLHSRLVLRTSFLLIGFGALGLAMTEWLNKGGVFIEMTWSERWMTALFESGYGPHGWLHHHSALVGEHHRIRLVAADDLDVHWRQSWRHGRWH